MSYTHKINEKIEKTYLQEFRADINLCDMKKSEIKIMLEFLNNCAENIRSQLGDGYGWIFQIIKIIENE